MSWQGKVVWITGASAGIGEALARAFAGRSAQAHGMEPAASAEAIVRAVEKGKPEVLIGGKERWAVHLYRFFPGLFHRLIRTAKVT